MVPFSYVLRLGLPAEIRCSWAFSLVTLSDICVAVAISLFGLHSGAALATVVGVLVEVPVMLSLVYFINRTKSWFGDADV